MIEYRNTLVVEYISLVKYHVKKIFNKSLGIDFEDFVSVGIIGLINAIDSFDGQKCVSIKTYITKKIRWILLDEIRKIRKNRNKIQLKMINFSDLGQNEERIFSIAKERIDFQPENIFNSNEIINEIIVKIDNLKGVNRSILLDHCFNKIGLKHIAKDYNVSIATISRYKTKLLKQLKEILNES